MLRIGVFIPAYQAEVTLDRVVRRIPPDIYRRLERILVQDDASKDGTWAVAERLSAEYDKVVIHRHSVNLGFGGTNKAAYRRMRDTGIEAYAVLHGDLQYDPRFLGALLEPIESGDADIVLGSRMRGHPLRGGMPAERWVMNKFLTWLLNRRLGMDLTDYHTGLVAFRCDALEKLDVDSLSNGHELTAEILARAISKGFRITEVTISTAYPSDSRSLSRWTGVKYAWHVVRMKPLRTE